MRSSSLVPGELLCSQACAMPSGQAAEWPHQTELFGEKGSGTPGVSTPLVMVVVVVVVTVTKA